MIIKISSYWTESEQHELFMLASIVADFFETYSIVDPIIKVLYQRYWILYHRKYDNHPQRNQYLK